MNDGVNFRNSADTLFHNDTDARQFRFFRIGMLPKQFFLIPGTDGDKIVINALWRELGMSFM